MPDRGTPEPLDPLDAFAPETDGSQPAVARAPLRGPRESSPLAAIQAVADRVDVLSITVIATTRRLTRSIIGLAVLTGLLVLALLVQTYLWLTVAVARR